MRILLLGSTGQLGLTVVDPSEIQDAVNITKHSVYKATRKHVDFSQDTETVLCDLQLLLEESDPDVLVNCAAYTDVTGAEYDPVGVSRVNHYGVAAIIKSLRLHKRIFKKSVLLIHISTDYVYGSLGENRITTPIVVNSDLMKFENPKNKYGISKLLGDDVIRSAEDIPSYIIRTSGLYGGHGYNIFKKIVESKVDMHFFDDVFTLPTPTYLVANIIWSLISFWDATGQIEKCKIIHAAPRAYTDHCGYDITSIPSWYDFAREVVKRTKSTISIYPQKYENGEKDDLCISNFSALAVTDNLLQALRGVHFHYWDECVRRVAYNWLNARVH